MFARRQKDAQPVNEALETPASPLDRLAALLTPPAKPRALELAEANLRRLRVERGQAFEGLRAAVAAMQNAAPGRHEIAEAEVARLQRELVAADTLVADARAVVDAERGEFWPAFDRLAPNVAALQALAVDTLEGLDRILGVAADVHAGFAAVKAPSPRFLADAPALRASLRRLRAIARGEAS